MAIQSDLILSINQIAAERGINPDEVMNSLLYAIVSNYQDMLGYTDNIEAYFDSKEDKIKVIAKKEVVDATNDDAHQIPLIQAILIRPSSKVGEIIDVDVSKEGDFGRIAAQSARSILYQKVRDIEKDTILKTFEGSIGSIETGVIQRVEFNKETNEIERIIVEIRKALATMRSEDKIPGEIYKSGNKIKVVIKSIEGENENRRLIVSRGDSLFLEGLFKLEVPEIESDTVEIKAVAREAGSRSKVAVWSNEAGIDAIGSCVGQRGVRINNITNELRFGKFEEKVDIILWDPNDDLFVANSLSPAQTIKVKYFENGIIWEELLKVAKKIDKANYVNNTNNNEETAIEEEVVEQTEKGEAEGIEISDKKDASQEIDSSFELYEYEGFLVSKPNDVQLTDFAIEPNTAKVIVPDEQLSLAIGKEGQNARLAARLTGIKIDIQGETQQVETNQNVNVL